MFQHYSNQFLVHCSHFVEFLMTLCLVDNKYYYFFLLSKVPQIDGLVLQENTTINNGDPTLHIEFKVQSNQRVH